MMCLFFAAIKRFIATLRRGQAPANALIVADGASWRHQIEVGARRQAIHVARVLESALLT
jgi:hypothetical protein